MNTNRLPAAKSWDKNAHCSNIPWCDRRWSMGGDYWVGLLILDNENVYI